MLKDSGAWPDPFVAPSSQRNYDMFEINSFWSEQIFSMLGIWSRALGFHKTSLNKAIKPPCQNIGSYAKATLKVRESCDSPK
jgi:hypothetical protein